MLTVVQMAVNLLTVWGDPSRTPVKRFVNFSDEEIKIIFNYIDKSDDDKISVKELKKYMVGGKCEATVSQELHSWKP